uniref:Sema domain-containing protein n=1 Tax=Meloidogyne javanica TaxID=6303 RepID=A0A915MBN7_MELJA
MSIQSPKTTTNSGIKRQPSATKTKLPDVQINGEDQQRKQQDEAILAVFRDSYEGHEVELQRMAMDRSTGRLYVGAVNHLYDLSPEGLAIREHALTGPRADSVLCA